MDAEKAAIRAIKHGEKSVLYPIIAARAAHELSEFKRRDAYIASAENHNQGESSMRLLSSAQSRFDQTKSPH